MILPGSEVIFNHDQTFPAFRNVPDYEDRPHLTINVRVGTVGIYRGMLNNLHVIWLCSEHYYVLCVLPDFTLTGRMLPIGEEQRTDHTF